MKTLFVLTISLLLALTTNIALAQDQPIANFFINTNPVCKFTPVNFNDLSTDPNGHTINGWSWDFGNGTTSTMQSPITVFTTEGSYTIRLIVTNDVGGSDTLIQNLNVLGVNVAVSVTNETCLGACNGTALVSAWGPDPPYSYLWSNLITTPNLEFGCPGTYTVTVTNSFGCTTTTNVTILQAGVVDVNVQTSQCVDSLGFGYASASVIGGSAPYTYLWSTGHTSQTATMFSGNYSVTVCDVNGCCANDIFSITSTACEYTLSGYIFNDLNENCVRDNGEQPLQGVMVYANPGPYYSYTNDSGYYSLPLEAGLYSVIPVVPQNWGVICPSVGYQVVTIVNNSNPITGINFGMEALTNCPILSVHIGNGNLRPCFSAMYYVSYSNLGTVMAENAQIIVDFDNVLVPVSSSLPWSSYTGNSYIFDIGNVDVFESGQFSIQVIVPCDLSLMGSTKCATAHIYPDSLCTTPDPAWDHSSVCVTGECRGDTMACFNITNTGAFGSGDMQGTSEYRIFANDTLVYSGTFQLQGGMYIEVCWPSNGAAIRLEADQRPNHPGSSHPRETIEDCGDATGTSLGYITTTPYDDQNDFIDISCTVLTGSYDPNDKSVQPSGVTSNHYIDNDVPLNYHINFQNTGTDTAFTIVVRDTLSQYLDVTTVQNGVSSHPCTFRVYETGILEWTFNNILLPDSNVNQAASHGFVNFTVNQKPLTPADYGTVISNSASIYFDFNPPVITNTVDLVYWELPLILTVVPEVSVSKVEIVVYPNPVTTQATFELKNFKAESEIELTLFDNTGRELKRISVENTNKIIVPAEVFKKGIYFYQVTDKSGILGRGKLIVE
ncbi:MAG: hypothetical protein CVU05_06965 [Bacteroidetes bacterium HGW-Bacteroidetes-21]|nr:MAG: hypothetical protein CVU05_06965 [Bacteroidetes bacterium HGW-Bacteroidetes-21]